MIILHSAAVEVAMARWQLAQKMGVWDYPEQEDDAQKLVLHLGKLPEYPRKGARLPRSRHSGGG